MPRSVLLDMIQIVLEMVEEAEREREGAIGGARGPAPAAHGGGAWAAADLGDLAARLNRLALSLASASDPPISGFDPREPWLAVSGQTARAVVEARRLRGRYVGPGLFADPAWDILLALLVARREGRRLTPGTLAELAGTPPTTAWRWIRALCRQGLVTREADAEDRRRVRIALTEEGAERLDIYLVAALWMSPILA